MRQGLACRDVCGIAGLYTKSATLREQLGAHLAACSSSCRTAVRTAPGVAFYRDPAPAGLVQGLAALAVGRRPIGRRLRAELEARFGDASLPAVRATHAVFVIAAEAEDGAGVAAASATPS